MPPEHTDELDKSLIKLRAGDTSMVDVIIDHTAERLRKKAHEMLLGEDKIHRWSETGDIVQDATIRLHRALKTMEQDKLPDNPYWYYSLAAKKIRQVIIEMGRKYSGSQGFAKNHDTKDDFAVDVQPAANSEPESPKWAKLHEAVEELPSDEQDVVSMIWYQGFNQEETAEKLEIGLSTVKRRWRNAKISLGTKLKDSWD